MTGQIYSIQATSTESFVEKIDLLLDEESTEQILISRYPQTRLVDLIDISQIQCYWLTTLQKTGTIDPSLEKINHFIDSTIQSGSGQIFVEGIEWLVSLHSFDAVYSMLRVLSDRVVSSKWTLYFSISEGSLEQRELSHFYREVPLVQFPDVQNSLVDEIVKPDNGISIPTEDVELDLNEDGTPKLVFLTRLPRQGFTKQILQRRILQWRRMGLDTSDIESMLYQEDVEKMYASYRTIEDNVRRATELERYIYQNIDDSQERTISMFRIRQLTGLDELELKYFHNDL